MKSIVVTVDGPAGAGKTETVKAVSRLTGMACVDTGAFYRLLAYAEQKYGAKWTKMVPYASIFQQNDRFVQTMYLDGNAVDDCLLRTPQVAQAASVMSARPNVRELVTSTIRRVVAETGGACILEGRDTGTAIFPDADLKFYLDADPVARAKRRLIQRNTAEGLDLLDETGLPAMIGEIIIRDARDTGREVSPLRRTPDMVYLDNTNLTLPEMVNAIASIVDDRFMSGDGSFKAAD